MAFSPRNKFLRPRGYTKQLSYTLDSSHPLSHGLIGCWLTGESPAGSIKDYSGRGQTMSVLGTPSTILQASHHGGQAFSCNGRNCYGTGSFYTITYPLTLSVWVYYLGNPGFGDEYEFISLTDRTGTGSSYEISVFNGVGFSHLSCIAYDGTNYRKLQTASAPTSIGWYHVAAVFKDSSTFSLYLNGVLQTVSTSTGGSGTPHPSPLTNANLGVYLVAGPGKQFNGYLEGGRVYNRALSQDEINILYTEPYAGLVPVVPNSLYYLSGIAPPAVLGHPQITSNG